MKAALLALRSNELSDIYTVQALLFFPPLKPLLKFHLKFLLLFQETMTTKQHALGQGSRIRPQPPD